MSPQISFHRRREKGFFFDFSAEVFEDFFPTSWSKDEEQKERFLWRSRLRVVKEREERIWGRGEREREREEGMTA